MALNFTPFTLLFQAQEKPRNHCGHGVFMVREAGVEPARPEWTLEPESSESANSTTRAYVWALSQAPSYNIIILGDCQSQICAFRAFCPVKRSWSPNYNTVCRYKAGDWGPLWEAT